MAYGKDYWLKLARDNGVPDDKVQLLAEAFSVDGFVKALDDGFLRHDDYSRQSDEIRKNREELKTWYENVLRTTEENKRTVDQVNTQLSAYRETYGELTGDNHRLTATVASSVTGDWISKKDFEEHMGRLGEQAVELVSVMTDAGIDYYSRFNEKLPVADLKKFAIDRKLPLSAAYEAFIRPKLDERASKDVDERVKRAREEGAREALARHQLPVDTRPPEPHFLFDRPAADKVPANDHERVAAFTDFFNSADMQEAARK